MLKAAAIEKRKRTAPRQYPLVGLDKPLEVPEQLNPEFFASPHVTVPDMPTPQVKDEPMQEEPPKQSKAGPG